MGLDQYLSKRTYIGANWEHRCITGSVRLKKNGELIKINRKRISYVIEEVGYWRKANQIHKWFVDNIQDGNDDCGRYEVSRAELKTLMDLCQQVLKDHSLAEKLLPTSDGFFFGCTDYSDYYFEQLRYTVQMLKAELSDTTDENQWEATYTYESSW